MASNFLLLPFLVRFLTADELGLWYVYLAIGGLVALFEFGFSPTFSRNITYLWSGARELKKEGCDTEVSNLVDEEKFACLLSVCKSVYRQITLIALIVVLTAGTAYVLYISYTSISIVITLLSWGLFVSSSLVNLYYLYYSALLRGIGKVEVDNKIKVVSRSMQLLISVILLFAGLGLIGAAIGYFAYVVVFRIATHRAFWKDRRIDDMHLSANKPSRAAKKEMLNSVSHNARKDGMVQVSNYVATQASTFLSSLLLGLQEAAYFSIGLQFATAIGTLSLSYVTALRPAVQSAILLKETKEVQLIVGRGSAFYLICYLICTALVLTAIYPLFSFIKPGSSFDPWVYTAIALYMFLFDWHSLFASILASFNRISYMWAYIVSSLIGICLSFIFVAFLDWKIWGLIGGIALSQLLYNNWKWPLEVAKQLDTTVRSLLAMGLHDWVLKIKKTLSSQ